MIDKLTSFFSKLAMLALFGMVLLIVYDAMVRYIFHSGSIALQELEWHFFDIVILLSLAYTLKHDLHVRVDIFYENFSRKLKRSVDILTHLLFILPFSFLLIYISYDFVLLSFMQQEVSSNPGGLANRFIVKSLITLGFTLLALQSIASLLTLIKAIKS